MDFVTIYPQGSRPVQNLGKYEIISEIGRGAMGAVYKARDPLIDRLVALKTITGGSGAESTLLERFYQEARSAGALQHPNIVTIFELGHEKTTPFIAMEFLGGQSLDRIIEQRPVLPLSVKLGYIVRVCDALAYAHQHNVIHRDIKPGNIMVTKEGTVKVVDFGIARLTDMSMTQPNMMIGSRAYMSPQLYKGERADARSDIWAVGVTFYELLAYKRPFTGDSEAELMFHIIYENPTALQTLTSDCTEELAAIVAKMLEKKAEDRYQSMDDVLHALEPVWKAAQQATVSGLLADCQDLLAANDFQRAQGLLRKALHIDVGNTQAKSLLEKVNIELRRSEILPRLQEHLNRGESLLKKGYFREARAEAEAALGLDSKHEPAKKLLTEVETAAARAQQLEQKLRLTKQRLAEGALTEAAAALGQVLEMDGANEQAQELKRQIAEEQNRREKRKKLSEALHRARTLWTELNYEESLAVLAAALNEFPNEPELKKLQETALADQAEQQKQRKMAEVRKFLAQLKFADARRVLEVLIKDHPQDAAVKNLQALALQEEQEQARQKRVEEELVVLRGLLGTGKLRQVVAKGEALLLEFPQEYELKELVGYARGELAHQEQRKKEEERERQIRRLLETERYREALDAAQQAVEDFPKQESFRRLAAEAEERNREEAEREKARLEMQRRVREINIKMAQEKPAAGAGLGQDTAEAPAADAEATRVMPRAEAKSKQEEGERQIQAVRSLVNEGNLAAATQLFNEVMATQILQPSDPRAQELRGRLSSLTMAQQKTTIQPPVTGPTSTKPPVAEREKPPAQAQVYPATDMAASATVASQGVPATMFSATRVISPDISKTAGHVPLAPRGDSAVSDAVSRTAVPGSRAQAIASPTQIGQTFPGAATPQESPASKPHLFAQLRGLARRPAVLAGVGAAVLAVVIMAIWLGRGHRSAASSKDLKLKEQAEQLWQAHQLDDSERVWRQLAQVKGPLQTLAIQQVNQIEQQRADEQRRFDEGESLFTDKKDYVAAQQAFQDVIQMNLWRADDATRELAAVKAAMNQVDIHKLEQDHFDKGVQLFQAKDFEQSRREFRAVLELNVPGSALRPQAESYLSKLRQSGDEKKLFDAALEDAKNENWSQAHDEFQEVANRKGSMSGDAKKQLAGIDRALQIQNVFEDSLRNGAFHGAKEQVNAAQPWPKTRDRLSRELRSAQQQQLENIRSSSQAAESKGDSAAIQRLQDDLHKFESRAEDPGVLQACGALEKHLADVYTRLLEREGDKAAFDAAVKNFEQAKEKRDMNGLSHAVIQQFQKIANGNGIYREQAQLYVKSIIPNAIQQLSQSSSKVFVPPISCGRGQPSMPSVGGAVGCSQLDQDSTLQWVGTPMVDFPDVAKQPGKLPYTLNLIITVDAGGNVKIDKEGNADKEFFKKAKDASKHWKTTIPKSGGKPVTVRFPLAITFQR